MNYRNEIGVRVDKDGNLGKGPLSALMDEMHCTKSHEMLSDLVGILDCPRFGDSALDPSTGLLGVEDVAMLYGLEHGEARLLLGLAGAMSEAGAKYITIFEQD